MIDNSIEKALNNALKDKGLQMYIELNLDRTYAVSIDTSVHDKQIRADVLKPIAQMIDNYACGRELHVINAINNYIYEKTKEQTNE